MRSFLPAAPLRALARFAGAAAVAVSLSACSFITGVPNVSRVELQVPVTTIAPGQQVQASGVPLGSGGNVITHQRRQVSFSSSDEAVAIVSPSGLITGIAPGRATVRATSDGKSASTEITVRPIPVRQVLVTNRSPIVRLAPSVTVLLSAAVIDTNNQLLGNRPPTWRSLDPTVATVSAAGAVVPRALGTARVIASVDTGLAPRTGVVADTVTLRVTPVPIVSIRVNPRTPTLYTGQTQQFTATVVDSLQQVVTDRKVTWTTSDRGSNLAIDSTGRATGVAPAPNGTTVTATVETVEGFPNTPTLSDAVLVPVLAPAASARAIGSGGGVVNSIALRTGASQQLTFQALDAAGNVLAGRQFSVTSDTPAVATASAGGLVTAGTTAGAATIIVQPLDANGNPQGTPATVTVSVSN
jgi:uncharacterized protein YjdB